MEFQVRRDEMRELWSVDNVEDLFLKLPAICEELTTRWLRFTEEPVDREDKHHSRAVTWSAWCEVQEMFARVFRENGVEAGRPVPRQPSIERTLRQALGCTFSAAAVSNFTPTDAGEFFVWLEGKLISVMGQSWYLKLKRKARILRARTPVNNESGDPWGHGRNEKQHGEFPPDKSNPSPPDRRPPEDGSLPPC